MAPVPRAETRRRRNLPGRRQAIAHIRATEPDCWLCGQPIDLTLDAQRHPDGSSIDEIIPVSLGGSTLDLANLRHAHRICNQWRGARPVTADLLAEIRRRRSGSRTRRW